MHDLLTPEAAFERFFAHWYEPEALEARGPRSPLPDVVEWCPPGTPAGEVQPLTVEGQDVWRFVRLVDRLAPEEAPWADVRARIETDLASHPLRPEELAVFEARMRDRYRVSRPGGSP